MGARTIAKIRSYHSINVPIEVERMTKNNLFLPVSLVIFKDGITAFGEFLGLNMSVISDDVIRYLTCQSQVE